MSRVTAIISALVICIIVSACRINHSGNAPDTPENQRDKNARELKLANAAITDMQMRQRDICCARCKIHEGVG